LKLRPHSFAILLVLATFSAAQEPPAKSVESQRIFSQPVEEVRAALQKLPGGTAGRLPTLDGFVVPGAQALSSYRRPYYQYEVRITSATSGGSLAQVTAKVTAWFSSPEHSGYQALISNGRLESDLLDRLQEALEAPASKDRKPPRNGRASSPPMNSAAPQIDAPVPQLPNRPVVSRGDKPGPAHRQDSELQQEANSLEEILRNQSHPTNLIAVKQDGTPVLQSPAVDAKVLFLASAEDEFEVLDETPGWVHVRISGLSRGWLRRSTVEMPGESQASSANEPPAAAPRPAASATASSPSAALFSVSSQEVGSFPGDWTPLKGKNVKIISLQQAPGSGRITSPQEKKQFAAGLLRQEAQGLAADSAGVVLVFDAEDGGMVAATRRVLGQWSSGALSDAAFWKQCYLDPPEIMGAN
jgi:hypothetical protein